MARGELPAGHLDCALMEISVEHCPTGDAEGAKTEIIDFLRQRADDAAIDFDLEVAGHTKCGLARTTSSTLPANS